MRYVPNEEDKHYLWQLRKSRLNPSTGKSALGKHHMLASMPEDVYNQMKQEFGPNWINEKNGATMVDFLRKNPQYRIGKPGI